MPDSVLIEIGLPIALFIIMTGMGLSLTTNDFRRVVEQPRAVAVGTACQLALIPALGFLIAVGTANGLMAASVILIAALPGGTTSNLFCYLGRANLALSITLTATASLATVLTLPLYTNFGLVVFTGDSADIQIPFARTLLSMTMVLIAPVTIGLLINQQWPSFAKTAEPFISVFSTLILLLIVIGIFVTEWANIGDWFQRAWLPVILLNVMAIAMTLCVAKLAKLSSSDAITIALESGIKNSPVGLMVALTIVRDTELAFPVGVYGTLMFISGFGLALWNRNRLMRG